MSERGAVQAEVGWHLGQAVVAEVKSREGVQTVKSGQPKQPQIVVAHIQYLELGLKWH